MALLFAATVCLYAFLPTIMTVTQALVEPRMRASAAALHSFGQTVAGLGIGSVLLGYLSDRLADSNFAGDYAAIRSEAHTSELQSLMRISSAVFCWNKTKIYKI